MTKGEAKVRSPIREALSHRDFRNLALANAVSETGDWLYNVALLVYVFEVTHSPTWIAIATLFRLLPSVVVTPFTSIFADRYERRAVMMWSAGLGAIIMGVLAVLAGTTESAAGAVLLAFLCNAALTPYRPAAVAITPSMLPERSLAAGNTILATILYVAIALGPAVGGVLLLIGSPAIAFAFNGLTFLGAVLILTLVKTRSREDRSVERPKVIKEFKEGMIATFTNADARIIAFILAAANFFYGQEVVALVTYSDEQLGVGPDGITYLMAGMGVGGMVAAAFTSRIGETARPGRFIWLSSFLQGSALILLAFVSVPGVAYVIATLDGAGALLADVVCLTLLQRTVSQNVLGRVYGAVDAMFVGGILLGSLVTPWILAAIGVQLTLIQAGVTLPILILFVAGSIRRMDQRSAERKAQLDDLVELLAQSRLMEGAPRQALELVAANLEPLSVVAGTDVVVQGDEAENLYVIRSGNVDVVKLDDAGVTSKLATLGQGDYFGEIGVLEGKPRMATVTTTTDNELFKIKGEDFLAALELATGVAGRISGTAAARLAEAEATGRDTAA